MRNIMRNILIIALLTLIPIFAHAKPKKPAPSQASGLSTDLQFDALTVHGRYQFADEALATVEDEKMMTSLLNIRPDFKDRLQVSTKKR